MRTPTVAVAVACAVALLACPGAAASGDELPAAAPVVSTGAAGGHGTARTRIGRYNPSDIMFLQMMLAHNAQGVAIARLGAARGTRPEVRAMAASVASAQ